MASTKTQPHWRETPARDRLGYRVRRIRLEYEYRRLVRAEKERIRDFAMGSKMFARRRIPEVGRG